MQNHILFFGLGFTAKHLALQLLEQGWRVSGTSRTSKDFQYFRQIGITPHIFDEGLPIDTMWDMDSVTHIITSAPPSENGDPVLGYHLDDMQSISNLQWVGYLSTTGVYGDYQGDWVDESADLKANNVRSKRRVQAEQDWLNSKLPVHIFRLSGIYGKGRSVIDSLKNGTAKRINKPTQVFSRIHVEDICQTLLASIDKPNPMSIYNCADDLPCPQAEVVEYAAKLIDIEPPELVDFENANLSPMAKSFYSSCRRVENNKIKEELSVKLKYPTYKEGLEFIAQQPYSSIAQ